MGAIEALAASFALMLVGAGLARLGVVSAAGWTEMEKLAYWALFPALLVASLVKAPPAGLEAVKLGAALVGGQLFVFALVWGFGRRRLSGPALPSVVQGAIRYNTYIAFATALAAQGPAGLERLTPALAPLIIAANILSVGAHVLALNGAGRGTPTSSPWLKALKELATNPLVLASALGLTLNLAGAAPPGLVLKVLEALGGASLPLALLAVGAGVRLGAETLRDLPPIFWTGLAKFLVWPAASFAAAWALGLGPEGRQLAVLTAAAPTATASYVLARRMGGDARLMASLISAQTLLAAPVLFLLLSL
ncbi:AEC family transporter [Neomegalonema sp.]|uniref:AEC family transporter n=1 Tax=Neomegalonema sp. TaxID=2039713 RepID=UPI002609BCE2|nr:AEC family transporter [Neomegalonema sp.]MDD2869820.1 AEC family transporter [Neomegalonema sp.]